MKDIKKEILKSIGKKVRAKDKMKFWLLEQYTYDIYRMGYMDGYYYKKKRWQSQPFVNNVEVTKKYNKYL